MRSSALLVIYALESKVRLQVHWRTIMLHECPPTPTDGSLIRFVSFRLSLLAARNQPRFVNSPVMCSLERIYDPTPVIVNPMVTPPKSEVGWNQNQTGVEVVRSFVFGRKLYKHVFVS